MSASVGMTPQAAPRLRPAWFQALKWKALLAVTVVVLLAVWELSVSGLHLIDEVFLPPPSAVIASLVELAAKPQFWSAFAFSLVNLLIGVAIAVVVGVTVGLAVGWFPVLRFLAAPFLWLFYSTPKVALAPLFILILGLGSASKIALVFLLAVFPIVLNTMEGAQTVNKSLISAGRVFGARGVKLGVTVIFPGTLPFSLVGIQRGAALGFTGEILGELLGGSGGLGHMLQRVVFDFNMDKALAIVIVVAAVASLILALISALRKKLAPWYDDRATAGG